MPVRRLCLIGNKKTDRKWIGFFSFVTADMLVQEKQVASETLYYCAL